MMTEITEDKIIKNFLNNYSKSQELRSVQEKIAYHIPAYIQRFRTLAHRMTQKELATALGVDHSYISKLENGHETPSQDFLAKFESFIREWSDGQE